MKMTAKEQDRFWIKVRKPDINGCWRWWKSKTSHGYGCFKIRGRSLGSHRLSYETLVGPIPVGLVIDHLCRVVDCVNPSHMEPVTDKENILRGVGAGAKHARQTHCHQGHEFTEANTLPYGGFRRCRACQNVRHKEWYDLRREEVNAKAKARYYRRKEEAQQ